MEYPKPIQKLIDRFSEFPTVGPRTAGRFVFYLLSLSKEELENLADLIKNLKGGIVICSSCFNPFEKIDDYGICPICRSPKRDKSSLCVVEKETDLLTLEKTKKYQGLYFILGGLIRPLKKEKNQQNVRLKELEERLTRQNFSSKNLGGQEKQEIKEIVLAINPTVEGEATISDLTKIIKEIFPEIKITRLGRGLPQGGEMEYADEETLSSALESRR